MQILSEGDLFDRLEYMRPLNPPNKDRAKPGRHRIPFPYGANEEGTMISVPLARQIAAELIALVAQDDERLLREAYQDEKRNREAGEERRVKLQDELFDAQRAVAGLTHNIRRLKKERAATKSRSR